MKPISAALLVAASLALPFANAYAAHAYPKYVTLPDLPIDRNAVHTDERAESEFLLRDKRELHRGHVWLGHLDYQAKWGEDRRNALDRIVAAMQAGGWEVMMRDDPANPPFATLKLTTDDNKVVWASVEVSEKARVLVLEQRD